MYCRAWVLRLPGELNHVLCAIADAGGSLDLIVSSSSVAVNWRWLNSLGVSEIGRYLSHSPAVQVDVQLIHSRRKNIPVRSKMLIAVEGLERLDCQAG